MPITDTLFDEVRNIGYIDRAIRIIAGSAAIMFVMAGHTTGMLGWMAVLPLLAVYPIITGMISYDPVYAWLQIDTSKSWAISDAKVMRVFGQIADEHPVEVSKQTDTGAHHSGNPSKHKDAA